MCVRRNQGPLLRPEGTKRRRQAAPLAPRHECQLLEKFVFFVSPPSRFCPPDLHLLAFRVGLSLPGLCRSNSPPFSDLCFPLPQPRGLGLSKLQAHTVGVGRMLDFVRAAGRRETAKRKKRQEPPKREATVWRAKEKRRVADKVEKTVTRGTADLTGRAGGDAETLQWGQRAFPRERSTREKYTLEADEAELSGEEPAPSARLQTTC